MATSDDGIAGAAETPRCFRCRHLRITHDPAWPYACLALKFKSRIEPAREVLAASGMPCEWFARKPARR